MTLPTANPSHDSIATPLYMTRAQAAARYCVSPDFLRKHARVRPLARRLSAGKVVYAIAELDALIVELASEQMAAPQPEGNRDV